MGKLCLLYLSQGNAGQGQGGQAGARQTDSDEQRFRRWLDIPIGSAGVEQVQEPGRGWMLVQCCIWAGALAPFAPGPGKVRERRSQSVSHRVSQALAA